MFRFKQFNVDQTGCAMKINTDGVLLGVLAEADQRKNILDIGTGTGVISLMLAQRFANTKIDAVEIDKTAAATAKRNFEGSPFADRLSVFPLDFERFFDQNTGKYDLIISNPPFYINSLESPGAKTNLAKHADQNFFESLVNNASKHLNDDGEFWLILPIQTAELVRDIAENNGLVLKKKIDVLSYPESDPHREILVFAFDDDRKDDERFVIYKEPKVYSQQYQEELKPFFTIF